MAEKLKSRGGEGAGTVGAASSDEDASNRSLAIAMYLLGLLAVDGEDWGTGQRQLTVRPNDLYRPCRLGQRGRAGLGFLFHMHER